MVELDRWLQGGYFMWENPAVDRVNIACVKNINNELRVLIWNGHAWRMAIHSQADDQRWQTQDRGINDCVVFNLSEWNQHMGAFAPQPPDIYNDDGVRYYGGGKIRNKKNKHTRKKKRNKMRKSRKSRKSKRSKRRKY